MTTSLLIRLQMNGAEALGALNDHLELMKVSINEGDYQEVWVIVYALQLSQTTRDLICGHLQIPTDRLLTISKFTDPDGGTRLLASIIAYLGSHTKIVLHDANSVSKFGELVPTKKHGLISNNGVYGHLSTLRDLHRDFQISTMLSELEGLIAALEREVSALATTLLKLVRPLSRFIRTLQSLILFPNPSCKNRKAGFYDSLSIVDIFDDVDRLLAQHNQLEECFLELEIVNRAVKFFQYGARVNKVTRKKTRYKPNEMPEHFPYLLTWWYEFYLSASRELSNIGYYSGAIILLARAFESYSLAFLGHRQELMTKTYRKHICLRNGEDPSFANLKRELELINNLSQSPIVNAGLEELRHLRNGNLFIHGFHIPNIEVVKQSRTSVKGVVTISEALLPADGKLLRGELGKFSQGERLQGDLGRVIAEELLHSARPTA